VPPAAEWSGSVSATVDHVLSPLLSSGAFAPALVWAAAALVLPWVLRGRSPLTDLIAVAIWSAVLALCTALAVTAVSASAAPSAAPTAVVGAVVGAIIALAPSWLSSIRLVWRPSRHPTGPGGQFP
jgi:eukaryotic-like serine/threonine-protein kinase